MDKSKEKARQIKDLLSVCLAKSIDKALVEKVGTDWFKQFMQEDQ